MRQISSEGHSTKYLLGLCKAVEVIKNKESLRNCNSQEEPKEYENYMQCGALSGILKQKKDIKR